MRKRPAPLSAAEQAKRRPPPPDALVGALQDSVHKGIGRLIRATPIRKDRDEDRARAAWTWSYLSRGQRDALYWAHYWTGRGDVVGYAAKGSVLRAAAHLVQFGLCDEHAGCDMDDHSKARLVYSITPYGRLVYEVGNGSGWYGRSG